MTCKKWFLIEIVFFLVFLTSNSKVYSGNSEELASLRGLWGMDVVVGLLPPEFEGKGLTREQIKTDVELKLRLAGIKVVPWEDDQLRLRIPGSPFLQVHVYGKVKLDGSVVCSIHIALWQRVILERDPKIEIFATTWHTTSVGIGSGGSDWIGNIRNSIKDQVDIFINDFLSVNSKGGN